MAEIYDRKAVFVQNLIDSGCDEEMIKKCVQLVQAGDQQTLVKRLSAHRNSLLKAVHTKHKEIDCLDYLLFQLNRNEKGGFFNEQ